jgi:hypothetical protein
MNFTSDRVFHVWSYSVSHAQLLLRSPAGGAHTKNVDVAFFGVDRMAIATGFDRLEIEEVFIDGRADGMRRFRLRGGDESVGEIDAADIRISENELDRSETDLPNFTVRSVHGQ